MSNVTVSESAITYLKDLLSSQDEPTNIKIFVSDPGTTNAETCIVYCKVGEEEQDDILMDINEISIYLESESLPFLEDCKVDYHPDKFGVRTVTWLFYLHECGGGETEFKYGRKIKPETGKVVFFPSTWCMIHRGCPVTEGQKYLCVGWFYSTWNSGLDLRSAKKLL